MNIAAVMITLGLFALLGGVSMTGWCVTQGCRQEVAEVGPVVALLGLVFLIAGSMIATFLMPLIGA